MARQPVLRWVLVVVAGLCVLALVAVAGLGLVMVRRPLPDHDGTATVPGLTGDVVVSRDELGVPQLYADDAEDLFMAQGYVHAQDRFWEMDYRRHVTAGRLSELVGADDDALAADAVIRTFGWREVAEQEWRLLSEDTRAYLTAYAAGVNAYLAGRSPAQLAVEYTVLGTSVEVSDPEPWDPVDSLAWLKAMAWDLRGNYDEELSRALAYSTLGSVERVEELFPAYDAARNLPILTEQGDAEPTAAAQAGPAVAMGDDLKLALESVAEALDAVPHLIGQGDGVGSNSWVVSGDLTASGAPLLANDPHLSISAPGIWYQIGLHCTAIGPDCPFDVAGFSFASFPGVIIGHNAELAWGLTNLGADVIDFFLERTTEDETYLVDGDRLPITTRTETIAVNGGEDVEIEVRSTHHGPIVSGVLDDVGRAGRARQPGLPGGETYEVSMAWTALTPGRTADAVFAFATAADAQDVAAAAALFEVPSQNIVFATTAGDIGYQAPGRVPLRTYVAGGPTSSDGTWPRAGWDSRYDWQGFVPAEQMPAAVNPAEGFIVAANQAVTAAGAGPTLTLDWDYGYRSQRIREAIEQAVADGTAIDVAWTQQVQADTYSPYAELLVPVLLELGTEDSFTTDALDLLVDWDYHADADSAAAAYFMAVWAKVLELTFWDELPAGQRPSGDSRWLEVVRALLAEEYNTWWDDRSTVTTVESRDEILSRALTEARLELTRKISKDVADWRWGVLHRAEPVHAVLGGSAVPAVLHRLVNPAPLEVGGGSAIVAATSWDAASGSYAVTSAPSMRMVVDLADLDASTWVNFTGSSGHPGSEHYTDQFQTWADGGSFRWPFTEAAVTAAQATTLTLHPAD